MYILGGRPQKETYRAGKKPFLSVIQDSEQRGSARLRHGPGRAGQNCPGLETLKKMLCQASVFVFSVKRVLATVTKILRNLTPELRTLSLKLFKTSSSK